MTPTRCVDCGAYTYPVRGKAPTQCGTCGASFAVQRQHKVCTYCDERIDGTPVRDNNDSPYHQACADLIVKWCGTLTDEGEG